MKYIESTIEDIYINLALEEYIYQNLKNDDYFMLWKNDNSIVLGKYQNTFEEINTKEAEKKGMKVARRNTGGGTVFHDKGNLNYSIIKNVGTNTFADYDSFLIPMISALNAIGVKAEKRRTSDIVIEGKKISGSAQTLRAGRILHHGTLLFNADLSLLENMLKTTEGKIESRSVKSVRSIVTNIKDHIEENISLNEFKEALLQALFPDGIEKVELTIDQMAEVYDLAKSKYSDWNWNYGNSPEFSFEKNSMLSNENLIINLQIKKGIIVACKIKGTNIPCSHIESIMVGSRYSYKEVLNKLQESNLFTNINYKELADCFF
ncbi:MAG TPA: lipoate--protein ligase [Sedimentibacter sp.]|nr:lipoate--protein ligase [Sedimentibacter sp.]